MIHKTANRYGAEEFSQLSNDIYKLFINGKTQFNEEFEEREISTDD